MPRRLKRTDHSQKIDTPNVGGDFVMSCAGPKSFRDSFYCTLLLQDLPCSWWMLTPPPPSYLGWSVVPFVEIIRPLHAHHRRISLIVLDPLIGLDES